MNDQNILSHLPCIENTTARIDNGCVVVEGDVSPQQREVIRTCAVQLKNWKKGPFNLFGLHIDSEWRSDLKWQRLMKKIPSLDGQRVLDIGCNNGYFMFQMKQAGAASVLGIDPVVHFKAQFDFIQSFARWPGLDFQLLGVENLPTLGQVFDTIFSMGILYHHPNPIEQLQSIHGALRAGGSLILETIGIPSELDTALCPTGRYAQMRNVWFLPSLSTLLHWIKKTGFKDIEVLSTEWGEGEEQRSTDWSAPVSYCDFLDPHNPQLTVEGYPAPRRFMVKALKP